MHLSIGISVNDKTYKFFETTQVQRPTAILQPSHLSENVEETLSLEMVKELRTNSTEATDLIDMQQVHTKGIAINLYILKEEKQIDNHSNNNQRSPIYQKSGNRNIMA